MKNTLDKIQVLGARVLVKLETIQPENDGFVVITSDDVDQTIGYVALIGKREDGTSMEIIEGEKVMFNRYAGTGIKIEGIDYRLILESDVLLVLNRQ